MTFWSSKGTVNRPPIARAQIVETSKAAFFTILFTSANRPASNLYFQKFLNTSPIKGSWWAEKRCACPNTACFVSFLVILFLLVMIANYKTFIQNIASLKYQYNTNWRSVPITLHFIKTCKSMLDHWELHNTNAKKLSFSRAGSLKNTS